MKCLKVQRNLSVYLDGELTKTKVPRYENHLKNCSHCQEELNLLKGLSETLKLDKGIEPSPYFAAHFWRKIAEQKRGKGIVFDFFLWPLQPVPIFVQAILIITLGIFLGKGINRLSFLSQEKNRKLSASLTLERFSNFPPNSLSRSYLYLTSEKRGP